MGTTSDKLTYLNETKTLLKNKINLTGANITNDTFRQYPTKLQNALLDVWNNEGEPIFTNWGTKVNGEGTNVNLDNTINARMKLTPKGNTTQNGTPTPSSPIPVNVVSGDNEVDIVGKNLCYLTDLQNTQNIRFYFTKLNSKNIALSFTTNEALSGNSLYLNVDGTSLGAVKYLSGSANTKITTNISLSDSQLASIQGGNQCWFTLYKNGANFQVPNDSQLEVGSTATTYEPYTSQNYPLYLGVENLLNLNSFTATTQYGVSITPIFNNGLLEYINVNGTFNSSSNQQVQLGTFNATQGTTYYMSGITGWNYNTLQLWGNNSSVFPIGNRLQSYNGTGSATAQATNSVPITLYMYVGQTYNNVKIYPVVSTQNHNSYTPYGTTPIELCNIGNYVDFPFKAVNGDKYYDTLTQAQKDLLTYGKWYLHKEIEKVVLNGSESWTQIWNETNRHGWRVDLDNALYPTSADNYLEVDSNYYKSYAQISLYHDIAYSDYVEYGICIRANYSQLIVKNNDYTSASDLQTWLSTHNTIVYYVLATPTEEEITNSTLINQLEQLKGAMSYEGQTNISSGFMIVGASALGELE